VTWVDGFSIFTVNRTWAVFPKPSAVHLSGDTESPTLYSKKKTSLLDFERASCVDALFETKFARTIRRIATDPIPNDAMRISESPYIIRKEVYDKIKIKKSEKKSLSVITCTRLNYCSRHIFMKTVRSRSARYESIPASIALESPHPIRSTRRDTETEILVNAASREGHSVTFCRAHENNMVDYMCRRN
jgi:hypothetical protein